MAFVFPAGIGALQQRHLAFGVVRQVEELRGHVEGFVDLRLRNVVIDELEETDFGRGLPELVGDLGLAGFEIAQIDAWHVAGFGATDAAEGLLFLELGEAVCCVHDRLH